jgi:hypothetical protein
LQLNPARRSRTRRRLARQTVDLTLGPPRYADALPGWQRAICQQVPDLVHEADPDVVETIKRARQPYFALLAARTHVNVFVYDGAIVPTERPVTIRAVAEATMRTTPTRSC